jgi:hypothetical protein
MNSNHYVKGGDQLNGLYLTILTMDSRINIKKILKIEKNL